MDRDRKSYYDVQYPSKIDDFFTFLHSLDYRKVEQIANRPDKNCVTLHTTEKYMEAIRSLTGVNVIARYVYDGSSGKMEQVELPF